MNQQSPTTAATHEDLVSLWGLVLKYLQRVLVRPKVPIDMIREARRFLEQAGYIPDQSAEKTRKRIARLDQAFSDALITALKTHPTAAVLAEAKAWRVHLERVHAYQEAHQSHAVPFVEPFKVQ